MGREGKEKCFIPKLGEALQFPWQKINAEAYFTSLGGLMRIQCSKQCQNKVGVVEVLGIFIVKHFDFSPFTGPLQLAIIV